jgi:hypothetical protein
MLLLPGNLSVASPSMPQGTLRGLRCGRAAVANWYALAAAYGLRALCVHELSCLRVKTVLQWYAYAMHNHAFMSGLNNYFSKQLK